MVESICMKCKKEILDCDCKSVPTNEENWEDEYLIKEDEYLEDYDYEMD